MAKYKGFTLVELLVSIGILSLIVGLTAGVLITVIRSYQKQRIIAEIERNGDFVMRNLEESIRGATSVSCMRLNGTAINPSSPGGSVTCPVGSTATGGRMLYVQSKTPKYFGRGSGESATPSASCTAGANCFAYMLNSRSYISGSNLTTNTVSLTNNSVSNGVNISRFDVIISGGANGTPYNVTVTMDVKGPTGSAWANETRTFQSFLTLRGSYQ